MALGLDGDALDRSRYEGSRQRLSTTEGSQATSSLTCRSARTPEQKLTRRPCSPSQRRLTSISAATASDAYLGKCLLHEFTHGMGLAGREDVIVGLGLLQDAPHPLDIVARVGPVALRIQITEKQLLLMAKLDG